MSEQRNESRVLKGLLREVYLLLLALLAFINFFVPAMIHAVYTPDAGKPTDRIWIRLLPDENNEFQQSLEVGKDIGVAIGDDDEFADCFGESASTDLTVNWGVSLQSLSADIKRKDPGKPVRLFVWLARMPGTSMGGGTAAASLKARIKLLVYHDRDSVAVYEELQVTPNAPGRLSLDLSPATHYQSTLLLPEGLLSKQ